jgi:GTP-binding protein
MVLVDRAKIFVRGGDGGNGSASFLREKFVTKGGPDGGDGGRGGDVILRVRPSLTSLIPFQYAVHFKAEPGQAGAKRNCTGKTGKSVTVDVPAGTVVFDDETGEQLADLTEPNQEYMASRGGRGGLGNTHFKTSTHRSPRIAELGEPAEERWIRLELRMIADVGLVGLPNAGKSTTLTAATAARPKIADYPFTTLEPNLGVVEIGGKWGTTFVLADIPGLIEGAADGAGLGHEFLRHVQRTKVLIHVLDAAGGLEGRDPLEDFETINSELELYDEKMRAKPMLVALNKVDLAEARENLPRLRKELSGRYPLIFEISAATGEGVSELMAAAYRELQEVVLLEKEAAAKAPPEVAKVYTIGNVSERAWEATRMSAHHFTIAGIGIERFTKMTNFGNAESIQRFQRVLKSSGIASELHRLGISDGDTVHIANIQLTWGEPDPELPSSVRMTRRQRTLARMGGVSDDEELTSELEDDFGNG